MGMAFLSCCCWSLSFKRIKKHYLAYWITMGKNRHSKDRLFITATEWKRDYGGKKVESNSTSSRPLPFDHCALSLGPFHTPVLLGKSSGVIFDMENIVPFVQKHKNDPVSGDSMTTKDIIRLNMEKNSEGHWQCPVTHKVFTNSSHIVAIATSGNVYSFDAVNELNIKAKNYVDLISGESFRKSDIVTVQDPQNTEQMARRDISNFAYLKTIREDSAESRKTESKVRHSLSTANVMKEIAEQKQLEKESGVKRKTIEEVISNSSKSEDVTDVARFLQLKPLTVDVNPGQVNTDGRASSSLTSSSSNLWTSNATRLATASEIREARWKCMRQVGKKAYAQLQTNLGNLNIEIHCDIAPRTAWNFTTLCLREYYDDMAVHRLVPGFMVQAGDPTGSGAGGKSAFGGGSPFKDEFDTRIVHDKRGVLSMANSGMNTNGSQFFIIFKPTPHLDLKHSVFGRVVGGLATLDRIEEIGANKKEQPLSEVKILKAIVFTNPIDEADELLEQFIKENMSKRLADRTTKDSASSSSSSSSSKVMRLK